MKTKLERAAKKLSNKIRGISRNIINEASCLYKISNKLTV